MLEIRLASAEQSLDRIPYPLVAATSIAAIILFACAVVRVADWTYGADTGTFALAISNAPHAMYDPFEGTSHFRFHWSPILIALYPLLAFGHSELMLQAVQIAAVVGSVLVFYSLIVPYLGRKLALRSAIVALLYPPLIGLAFTEFHELAFAPLLTLLMLQALANRKWGWYALWTALCVCVREDVALIVGVFGAFLALRGMVTRDRAYLSAGVVSAVGVAVTMGVYFGVIAAHFGGWKPMHFYTYLLGTSDARERFAILPRLTYVAEAVLPLALLPLRTRWWWFACVPLVALLFADSGDVWRMGTHYVALWLPWMLVAVAAALARIRTDAGEAVATRWSNAAAILCILFFVAFDPTHAGHYLVPIYRDLGAVKRVLPCIPPGALVGTHDEWYTAIALKHPNVTIGLSPQASYYLFASDYPNDEFQRDVLPVVRHQVATGAFEELCSADHVIVYRRINP